MIVGGEKKVKDMEMVLRVRPTLQGPTSVTLKLGHV